MNFNMNMRKLLLTSAVAFSAVTAFAADNNAEIVTQQKSLLEKLDSLNAAVLGLKINGTAKAGGLAAFSSSDQYATESPTQENQAFTDVNLRLTARPSSETMVDVQLRLHKDWQSAYDENNNPVIGHWFSYDGTILNKHVDFNLGYMRVGYTPLTINTPQTEILQEPEIFSEKRREALAKRNLDTTSRRLLQGLNIVYNSGAVGGVVDNISAQLTGARLRNTSKKLDQLFFDFDFSDRYLLGARAGADAYGAHLGVNFVNLLDRKYSRRSKSLDGKQDTVFYDFNRVISVDAAFDSKKVLPTLPFSVGFNGEFAMSNWKLDRDYVTKGFSKEYKTTETHVRDEKNFVYIQAKKSTPNVEINEKVTEQDGKSFYGNLFAKGSVSDVDFNVTAGYLQTDSSFWSELASSPVYQGRSVILNSNSFYGTSADSMIMSTFGASSLENLYFNVYNSTTLQARNMMSTGATNTLAKGDAESANLYANLYNNYKNGHFYRNGYTGVTAKKQEVDAQKALLALDPSVGLALPFGLATPDRKGVTAKADVNWADKVFFNARVNVLTQTYAPAGTDPVTFAPLYEENKFTDFGVGLGIDAGALAGLDRQLLVQGSFSKAKETAYYKRTATRIVAGLTLDVWGPISLLAGFQKYEKTFDKGIDLGLATVNKASEQLVMEGVRLKIAANSYVSIQHGILKNDLEYSLPGVVNPDGTPAAPKKLSISKDVILADVTVNF